MSVSGCGVSAGVGGGNVDLQAIISGGEAFEARLRQFAQAQALAEDAKRLRREAVELNAAAAQKLADAEAVLAANRAAAEELRLALAEAETMKAKYQAVYNKIMRIAGEPE